MQSKVGILTISDRGSTGAYQDRSGPVIQAIITDRLNGEIARTEIVPDEISVIKDTLITWVDEARLDLILTTGGNRFRPPRCHA